MSKTYVIADLHGRFDLLRKAYDLFEVIGADLATDTATIIHLGDYIDRGKQSREVIEFLMDKETIPVGFTRIVLRGNHEDMMLETMRKPLKPDWWIGNGGSKTLYSYGHPKISGATRGRVYPYNPDVVPQEHLDFIDGLPRLFTDIHRVYVHAGVDPARSLEEQKPEILGWYIYASADEGGYHGKHVVHGHHYHEDGPLFRRGRTNLDVNSWSTGRLVIGVFDDDVGGSPVDVIEVFE